MGYQKVPLYNSNGYGSCQVCGTPTEPRLLTFFDGKWVCPYDLRRHTRAEMEAAFTRTVRKYRHFVQISGSLGTINAGGMVAEPPAPPPPPTPPPPPNPGGGGGGSNPPPDTNPPGGTPPGFAEGNICID